MYFGKAALIVFTALVGLIFGTVTFAAKELWDTAQWKTRTETMIARNSDVAAEITTAMKLLADLSQSQQQTQAELRNIKQSITTQGDVVVKMIETRHANVFTRADWQLESGKLSDRLQQIENRLTEIEKGMR